MSLSSDEVNFLVYRYLLESGFEHSAFGFAHESHIARSNIAGDDVPAGALISYIQRGLQLQEMETHISEDGMEVICSEPFSVLKHHTCQVSSKRKLHDPDRPILEDFGGLELYRKDIHILDGHQDLVSACGWSSSSQTLASSSMDGSLRMWDLSKSPEDSVPIVAESVSDDALIAIGWSRDTLIAGGTMAGQLRLWTSQGELKASADAAHNGPVTALKWSPDGSLLCTGGSDYGVKVWSRDELKPMGSCIGHRGPIFDIDWKDDQIFASGSADKKVLACRVGDELPIRTFVGHEDDVNVVRWQPAGQLLASASDDCTVMLWNMDQDEAVSELSDHNKEVVDVSWAGSTPFIATASLDTTVRIYDVEKGITVRTFDRHLHPVTRVQFSRDAKHVASCANDRLYLWSTSNGSLIRTYRAPGGIDDIQWDPTGRSIALACANHSTILVDLAF